MPAEVDVTLPPSSSRPPSPPLSVSAAAAAAAALAASASSPLAGAPTEPLDLAKLSRADIRAHIPARCFERSVLRSLVGALPDAAALVVLYALHGRLWYPLWAALTGFIMWCWFVVGHDCGHGTFSSSPLLNDVFGHLIHGALLVPYWPWQLSHRQHHTYHQHITKDASHPWTTDAELRALPWLKQYLIREPLGVFWGFSAYLYFGAGDDHCHVWPPAWGRQWHKCVVSTLVVALYGYFLYWPLLGTLVWPWLVFHGWLYTVTFMQHHRHDGPTTVFNNDSWTFLKGAFETVDRRYGFGIDEVSHHITDCHVVHHLFPTEIAAHNLLEASEALGLTKKVVDRNGWRDVFAVRWANSLLQL